MLKNVIHVDGLLTALCARNVEKALLKMPGVHHVVANSLNSTATVHYDEAQVTLAQLQAAVADCGYVCAGEALPDHMAHTSHARPMDHAAHADQARPMDHSQHADHAMPASTASAHPIERPLPMDHGAHAGHAMPMDHAAHAATGSLEDHSALRGCARARLDGAHRRSDDPDRESQIAR